MRHAQAAYKRNNGRVANMPEVDLHNLTGGWAHVLGALLVLRLGC